MAAVVVVVTARLAVLGVVVVLTASLAVLMLGVVVTAAAVVVAAALAVLMLGVVVTAAAVVVTARLTVLMLGVVVTAAAVIVAAALTVLVLVPVAQWVRPRGITANRRCFREESAGPSWRRGSVRRARPRRPTEPYSRRATDGSEDESRRTGNTPPRRNQW
ncbi:MAG: hypothetical protein U0326_08160 [Polyangiales bacterium]